MGRDGLAAEAAVRDGSAARDGDYSSAGAGASLACGAKSAGAAPGDGSATGPEGTLGNGAKPGTIVGVLASVECCKLAVARGGRCVLERVDQVSSGDDCEIGGGRGGHSDLHSFRCS